MRTYNGIARKKKCKLFHLGECSKNPQLRRGYCHKHYRRLLKYGNPNYINPNQEFHGLRNHPYYQTWATMRKRCNNPNYHQYKDYGGRGIYVGEEFNSFTTWLDHIGPKPNDGNHYTQGRIDNSKSYIFGNVRWENRTQQNTNRRTVRKVRCVETGKVFASCQEAAKFLGLKSQWSIGKVLKGEAKTAKGFTFEYVGV